MEKKIISFEQTNSYLAPIGYEHVQYNFWRDTDRKSVV